MHHIPRGVGKRLTQDAETAEATDGGGCFSTKGKDRAFITQNGIDGAWETWIDGVTIRGADYDKVERIVSEVVCQRATKTAIEESLDRLEAERQSSAWGGGEIAIASGFALALLAVLAAGWQIVVWLFNG